MGQYKGGFGWVEMLLMIDRQVRRVETQSLIGLFKLAEKGIMAFSHVRRACWRSTTLQAHCNRPQTGDASVGTKAATPPDDGALKSNCTDQI